jgi:3'-phosphoadenosine 5'-phosphosulfate sulfotransferase (PAPS reductase)/FAD synthetase
MINILDSIQQVLAGAQSPAILCSFGTDSALLLHYARQVKRDISTYYFGDELPAFAAHMVINDDLTVHSFAPVDRYLVPDGDKLSMIDEYSFNGVRVPMISTVKPGENCRHGNYSSFSNNFYFAHDVMLWGYRYEDEISLLSNIKFEREIQLGHTRLIAPLYDLSTDQVWNALDALELSYVDDDAEHFCDACLDAVLSTDWDRDAALAGFRARFDYNH